MAKSITKPKNVIPTVVILDPAANKSVSRIPVATEKDIQNIISSYGLEEENQKVNSNDNDNTSVPIEDYDDSNMISATDDDIQNIIDDYDN